MSLSTAFGLALAVAAGGATTVLVVTTSGPFADSDEPLPASTAAPSPMPPTTSVPSASPVQTAAATATRPATPIVTKSYTQPASRQSAEFSFQYPATWFVAGGDIHDDGQGLSLSVVSWDRRKYVGPDIPKGESKVDVYVTPLHFEACPPPGQRAIALGSLAGWETVRNAPFTEPPEQFLSRIVAVGTRKGGFNYCVIGFFTSKSPDESGFRTIVSTLEVR